MRLGRGEVTQYICEIWVVNHGPGPVGTGHWLPADGEDWGTQDRAIDVAAAWEAEGYTARIRKRSRDCKTD